MLYSAAGNSADEHWYNRGVIAYSFETGADRYVDTSLSARGRGGNRRPAVATGRASTPATRSRSMPEHAGEEVRFVASVAVSNPPSPEPNVTLTQALSAAHAAGAVVAGGTLQ